jgi:hypothetical protein
MKERLGKKLKKQGLNVKVIYFIWMRYMIKKNQAKSIGSGKIVRNIIGNPKEGIVKNIVGDADYTEKKENYDMDRLKYDREEHEKRK